jgi:hypothetical protein
VAEKALETKAEEAKAAAGVGASLAPPPGHVLVPTHLLTQQPPMGPGGTPLTDEDFYDYGDEFEPVPVGAAPQAPQAAPQAPEAPLPAAPTTRLNLKAQKTARAAIHTLVSELGNTAAESWAETVMLAIGNEMTIYHYAKDVGVRYALSEGGAAPEMMEAIINALKTSPAVPDDLNYE